MSSLLEQIIATKRREVAAAKERHSETQLRDAVAHAPPRRDFFQPLAESGPSIRLIAEVKKASPSRGVIREDFDPCRIAAVYAAHGASCISVLTDESYFQGHLNYLSAVRQTVSLPLLRKDFIIDRYQLYEAYVYGADGVLLIAECLDDCLLRGLHQEAVELGLTPLVELYDPSNLPRVLEAGATLIGVNNRNLHTFATDLEHSLRLREKIPSHCVMVAESGIHSRSDVLRLEAAGIEAMLVGESLMASPDIGAAVDELLGTVR